MLIYRHFHKLKTGSSYSKDIGVGVPKFLYILVNRGIQKTRNIKD